MPGFFWAILAVLVAWSVGYWIGRSEGYWSAIGRPIPMREFQVQFSGFFVPAPADGISPSVDAALVFDKTGFTKDLLYVAAEPGYCFPATIDVNRDWRGRQIA